MMPWLLALIVMFVMLAELLIYSPSIALFRRDWLQQRIVARAGPDELRVHCAQAGFRDLRAEGMDRVLARLTTPEEISRAIHLQ